MKILKSIMMAIVVAATFVACKKDKAETHNQLPGVWQGMWGDVNQAPANFIKFDIKNDGTLTRLNEQGQIIANGTWSLNGVQFSCTYTHTSNGQIHKIAGLYTDFDGAITGTWGYSPSNANGGTIDLQQQ